MTTELPKFAAVCSGTIAVGDVRHDCECRERCLRFRAFKPGAKHTVRIYVGMTELKECEHFWEGE